MPVATTSTMTSPVPSTGSGTVCRARGVPNSFRTAAFMAPPWIADATTLALVPAAIQAADGPGTGPARAGAIRARPGCHEPGIKIVSGLLTGQVDKPIFINMGKDLDAAEVAAATFVSVSLLSRRLR